MLIAKHNHTILISSGEETHIHLVARCSDFPFYKDLTLPSGNISHIGHGNYQNIPYIMAGDPQVYMMQEHKINCMEENCVLVFDNDDHKIETKQQMSDFTLNNLFGQVVESNFARIISCYYLASELQNIDILKICDNKYTERYFITTIGNLYQQMFCNICYKHFTIPINFFKENVRDVSCSAHCVFVITKNESRVYCWGENHFGTLGLGDNMNNYNYCQFPQHLYFFADGTVTKIVCTNYTAFFITNDLNIYACGAHFFGQLGMNIIHRLYKPRRIDFFQNNIIDVVCGGRYTFALARDANNDINIYSWGFNKFGQLGLGDKKDRYIPELVHIPFENNDTIAKITCGNNHSFVITTNGYAYGAGYNEQGQLLLSHCNEVLVFTRMMLFNDDFPVTTRK